MAGSNTLGATIRLEGEKEYRESITKINSSLKVMASEMNKVTAEFSKNDKSTTAVKSYSSLFCNEKSNQKHSERHSDSPLGALKRPAIRWATKLKQF